jgi:hypothetical protein
MGADSIVSESTFGLFDDETDTFIDPNDYDGVEFDNAFIFVRGGRNSAGVQTTNSGVFDRASSGRINENTAGIQGGFATWINNLYLGIGFDTNLWNGSQTITKIDGNQADGPFPSWDSLGGSAPDRGIVFDGGFEALFGTEAIGALKLTLDFDQVSLNSAKNEISGANPEEFSYSDGKVGIALGWGKNFELRGGTLAPEFTIGYQISTFKVEQKNSDAFSYVKYYDFEEGDWVEDYFEKMSHLLVGANVEYTSPSEAHWFGLEYGLDIGLHPATIEKIGGADIDWKGYNIGNFLTGSYKQTVELNDQFALAFGGNLGLGLVTGKVDYTDLPEPIEFVDFTVNPDVEIGIAYDFAGKPFQLYSALMLSSIDEDLYTLSYGNDSSTKTETYTHTFVPWGLSAGLGLSFTPFENFTLGFDLSQNLSYYISDKLEYVWAWDLFNWEDHPFTATLQATFKF